MPYRFLHCGVAGEYPCGEDGSRIEGQTRDGAVVANTDAGSVYRAGVVGEPVGAQRNPFLRRDKAGEIAEFGGIEVGDGAEFEAVVLPRKDVVATDGLCGRR